MKTVVIFIDEDFDSKKENDLMNSIGKTFCDLKFNVDGIKAYVLNDKELALNVAITSKLKMEAQKDKEKNKERELLDYLDYVIYKIGNESNLNIKQFSKKFLKQLIADETLRNKKMIEIIKNSYGNKKVEECLKVYKLQNFNKVLNDLSVVIDFIVK